LDDEPAATVRAKSARAIARRTLTETVEKFAAELKADKQMA
jgi:hypothetical protein